EVIRSREPEDRLKTGQELPHVPLMGDPRAGVNRPLVCPPMTTVGDLDVHVLEAGPPDGPAVVLLHGFPELAYSWRHQLPALADAGYRALAPDLRGYGESSIPPEIESYDVLSVCGDLVGMLDELEEERAVFVGHDWGANV